MLAGVGAFLLALSLAPGAFFGGAGWQLFLLGGALLLSLVVFPFCLAWAALAECSGCSRAPLVWAGLASSVGGLLLMVHRWVCRLTSAERTGAEER